MAGIPLFSCRFARLGFCFFVCGDEFFFARMVEKKKKMPKKRGLGPFAPKRGFRAKNGVLRRFFGAYLRAAFWEFGFDARLAQKGKFLP